MIRAKLGSLGVGMAAFVAVSTVWADGQASSQADASRRMELRTAASFNMISDVRERSIALFMEAGKVLQHPRCMNCHPATESPTQTDEMRTHEPLVVRGGDENGAVGMPCKTCHHATNFDAGHIPGHAGWHLAPATMAWQGRSLAQICVQIKDAARNGGRDLVALVRHVSEDSLVGWAWMPGAARTPAPGTQQQFGELMKAWVATGAVCPA